MAKSPSPHSVGTAGPALASPSTILFIVWPEPGHSVGPLALASRLRARGHRVVFAGLPQYRPFIERHGLPFCGLAAPPAAPAGPSVFACPRSAPALAEAVTRLSAAFDDVCARYRPAAVLIDSLFSAFSLLPASRGLPWATYETDLPRELDVGSPPLPNTTRRHAELSDERARRRAWAELLWATYRLRRDGRASSLPGRFSMQSDFPDRLCAALRARVGGSVAFDRRSAFPPVAVGPRLVLASESMDFPRAARHALTYAGPCIETERREAAFEWSRLPRDKHLVYCSLGTQSFREPQAPELLRSIVAAVTACPELFLVVVACPAKYPELEASHPGRLLLVKDAPQLALLRRASLAITHGGFNGVKECALFGVPQVVVPLSHDQPRNAALVERLGVGVWLGAAELTEERLRWAIAHALHDPRITQRCRVLRERLEAENASPKAIELVEQLVLERPRLRAPAPLQNINQTGESIMNAPRQETQETETQEARAARLSCANPQFQRIADDLVLRVRRAMGVPDRAEPEVEQELSALRATLDSFYPEYTQLFSRQLFRYLGRAAPVVIASLESEPVQAYLRVAEGIDAEVNATLRSLAVRIGAALSPAPVA